MTHDVNSIESRNKQIIQAAFDKWAAGTGSLFVRRGGRPWFLPR